MLAVAQVKKEDLATKNTLSPGAETSVTINGKNIWIYYHAPSVRGRQIFGGSQGKAAYRLGECDGVGAVRHEVGFANL